MVVGLVAMVCLCWSGVVTAAEIDNPEATGGEWGVVAVSWLLAGVLLLPSIVLLRRRLKRGTGT